MSINIRNSETNYGLVARVLHWTSVTLLVVLIITADQFEELSDSPEKVELIRQHASYGLIFLFIMMLRAYWRNTNHNPVNSYSIQTWQKFAARWLHRSIYFVVIIQSVTGITNFVTDGKPIPFFNLFELPVIFSENSFLHGISIDTHVFLSIVIYPLFAIHISAAIYHQIFGVLDEDEE